MKIELKKSQNGASADVMVVFASQTKKGKDTTTKISHTEISKMLGGSVADKSITGKAKETVLFREMNYAGVRHVLVVGAGSSSDSETIRQAGAAAQKALAGLKITTAMVDVDGLPGGASSVGALTEGMILASYKFDELKSKKDDKKETKELAISLVSKKADAAQKKAFEQAVILAETVNFSRRLGDMPGNLMTPTILANSAVEAVKGTKIKVTVWDRARIKKENMGGLYGVAQGSDQEPRFIIMEYKGAAASKKPVVFVGKGLTFDCGGVSIKPGAGMEEMKYDMCGGANVIGAMLAIAKLKLKVNVYALIPSTENMVNGSATKPGDVHVARNGKSFEINNTDAEGRLILSDALSYGSELKPQLMVDAATLTGAMVVALGNIHTGFFTRDQKLAGKIERAAQASGELVWGMPLVDHHAEDMKGTYADLSNISSGKGAGSATAAAFLEQFVDEGIPWAHFDIAGTAWSVGNRLNYCSAKGASGAMVRTFVELAKQYE
ncbi:MAG: leucyl aminopeptidase [Bdellovibrionaceae bacterium]|nr:leucyl aminopeptidase [Pseudobdellovibrionaceae bacterium]